MEDAHTHILSMKEDKDAAFFAVFDGHGGLFFQLHLSYKPLSWYKIQTLKTQELDCDWIGLNKKIIIKKLRKEHTVILKKSHEWMKFQINVSRVRKPIQSWLTTLLNRKFYCAFNNSIQNHQLINWD